ncbi:MAG: hypothetical protein HY557_03060 [Euryarchaeota archaeon]|nr:hypothetical protein [Euryarchaeota archaeon]
MARPKLLGIDYAAKAAPVVEDWRRLAKTGTDDEKRRARAKLKSLTTFELRGRTNPLTAGDPVAKDRWPRDLVRDYGADIPNLFRFELADRWRGYYSLIGEPGGARIWILYLWDHRTYSKQSGYPKR